MVRERTIVRVKSTRGSRSSETEWVSVVRGGRRRDRMETGAGRSRRTNDWLYWRMERRC